MSWYVGFDCAIKTFAFSISYIDLELYKKDRKGNLNYKNYVNKYLKILDGDMECFYPNIKDEDINIVMRCKAVAKYIEKRIKPSIIKYCDINPKIMIEFQMGANQRARAIVATIITMFVDYDIHIIGATLKNKIYTSPKGKYYLFAEKYKTSYTANKSHALFNFQQIEQLFDSQISKNISLKNRGHIADSFIQILGYIIYGKNQSLYF